MMHELIVIDRMAHREGRKLGCKSIGNVGTRSVSVMICSEGTDLSQSLRGLAFKGKRSSTQQGMTPKTLSRGSLLHSLRYLSLCSRGEDFSWVTMSISGGQSESGGGEHACMSV